MGNSNLAYVGVTNIGCTNIGSSAADRLRSGPVFVGLRHSLATGAAFAAVAAFLAWAMKNTRDDPAHHAADIEADQPQPVAGLGAVKEI